MWKPVGKNFLYTFTWNSNGYLFRITNFKSAYAENLNPKEIEKKGDEMGNPFSLESTSSLNAFCKLIEAKLSAEDLNIVSMSQIDLSSLEDEIPWRWTFRLQPLPSSETSIILQSVILGLLGVVEKATDLINERNTVISKKNLVIRGQDEAAKRKVEYRPPPYLVDSYKTNETTKLSFKQLLETLEEPELLKCSSADDRKAQNHPINVAGEGENSLNHPRAGDYRKTIISDDTQSDSDETQ